MPWGLEMRHSFGLGAATSGGGGAGSAAPRTTAAAGLRTVVIEGGKEVGGLCILRGCMPTKALLYAAEVMHLATHAKTWGIHPQKTSFDFTEVMARKDRLIKEFADFREQQLTSGQFKFLRAHARFTNAHTLELKPHDPPSADHKRGNRARREQPPRSITAKHFIIATGSTIAPSPLPQLNQLDCLNSDTALKLRRLPKSMII